MGTTRLGNIWRVSHHVLITSETSARLGLTENNLLCNASRRLARLKRTTDMYNASLELK